MQAIDASENVDFNLHTHVECNSPLLPDSKTIVISTHALTWSATISSALSPSDCNFNSRTHVECDPMDTGIIKSPPPISTHALTWSATISEGTGKIFCYISTHALTWSATDAIRKGGTRLCDFNSRTHVECDLL